MFCLCRFCQKKYNNQASQSWYTGYCSMKCLKEMAKKFGWTEKLQKGARGCQIYQKLNSRGLLGDVPWNGKVGRIEQADTTEFTLNVTAPKMVHQIKVSAKSEEEAWEKAKKDGYVVESIERNDNLTKTLDALTGKNKKWVPPSLPPDLAMSHATGILAKWIVRHAWNRTKVEGESPSPEKVSDATDVVLADVRAAVRKLLANRV